MGGALGRLASKRQRCCSAGAARDRKSRRQSLGHLAVASRELTRVPVDALPALPCSESSLAAIPVGECPTNRGVQSLL